MSIKLKRFDRYDGLLTAICFIISLSLYTRTLTPGLLHGDSGEFQTLAYLLGHTHPTGYPVYLVLAKLTTFLPLGDVAYRVNLFSALMGAITAAGIYLSGRTVVKYRLLALLGAMTLAVSPTFWSQAIIAEVYTSGAAFLIFVVLTLLLWDSSDKPVSLLFAGLLGGLSLGVHMSVALLAPAVLMFLLVSWRRGVRMWKTAISGAVTGVILTIIIFGLIDLHNPTANYFNSVVEPSRTAWELDADEIDGKFERLLFSWSARQFQTFMFSDVANVMPKQAADYWQNLPLELGKPTIGFAAFGAIVLLIQRARVGILLVIGLAIQFLYMFNYEIWDLYVFYIPSYVLITLIAIAGAGSIVDLGVAVLYRAKSTSQRLLGTLIMEGVVFLGLVIFSFWPVFQPQKKATLAGEVPFTFDEYPSYDEFTLKISRAMVIKLPENAVVFSDWDIIWPYYYAAHIIEDRRDLTFIETYPADDVDEIAKSVADYVADNLDEHPIFFSEREPDLLNSGFKFIPARAGPVRLVRILVDD